MGEPYIYTHGHSNCCDAPVYDDSDICSACGEHCEVWETCTECDGKGFTLVMDMDKVTSRTTSYPDDKPVVCKICDGEGEIVVEI